MDASEELAVARQRVESAYKVKRKRAVTIYAVGNLILIILLFLNDQLIYLFFTTLVTTSFLIIKLNRLNSDLKYAMMLEEARIEANKVEESFGRFLHGFFERSGEDNEENIGTLETNRPRVSRDTFTGRRTTRRQVRFDIRIPPNQLQDPQDQRLETDLDSFNQQEPAELETQADAEAHPEEGTTLQPPARRNRRTSDDLFPRMEIFDHSLPVTDIENTLRTHLERGLSVVQLIKVETFFGFGCLAEEYRLLGPNCSI